LSNCALHGHVKRNEINHHGTAFEPLELHRCGQPQAASAADQLQKQHVHQQRSWTDAGAPCAVQALLVKFQMVCCCTLMVIHSSIPWCVFVPTHSWCRLSTRAP
jgi:hypothetical protein